MTDTPTSEQVEATQDMGASSGPGSREPDQQAVPALSGFDPSRVVWHSSVDDLPPRSSRLGLIWALGRYGDVYGPLPFEIVDDEAWAGNMGGASHDLVAWAVADVDWRDVFPLVHWNRDSDGNPEGRDGEVGSVRSMTARAVRHRP